MTETHLAELNVARLRYDINDPRIADFVNNLNRVNAAAERSKTRRLLDIGRREQHMG